MRASAGDGWEGNENDTLEFALAVPIERGLTDGVRLVPNTILSVMCHVTNVVVSKI